MRILTATTWAAVATMALAMAGCAADNMCQRQLAFSAEQPAKQMFHIKTVDDPFGGTGKVLKGGPLGPEEPYQNKGSFIASSQGFFKMPSRPAELRVRVAMTHLTELKVEVWAGDPKGSQKFRTTIEPGGWRTVAVPLDPAKIKPGSTINDITIFQVGKNKDARLYIDRVTLFTACRRPAGSECAHCNEKAVKP